MEEIRDKNGLTEAEYLAGYDSDKWKKPSLTADICIITNGEEKKILLIRRGNHPFLGKWALPGGFSEEGERIEETAARELEEETCIKMDAKELKLLGVYSKPGRDPRGWTVTAAYLAMVNPGEVKPIAADDAADAKWFTIKKNDGDVDQAGPAQANRRSVEDAFLLVADDIELHLSDLAFDHNDVVSDALSMIGL